MLQPVCASTARHAAFAVLLAVTASLLIQAVASNLYCAARSPATQSATTLVAYDGEF